MELATSGRRVVTATAALAAALLGGCGSDDAGAPANTSPSGDTTTAPTTTAPVTTTPGPVPLQLEFDFESGADGWESGVTDYTDATRPSGFVSDTSPAPPDGIDDTGFFLVGSDNPSDDVFVFLKRRVHDGVVPGIAYTLEADIDLLSSAPTGCAGIGGAPGEAVTMKLAATAREPVVEHADEGTVLSIDKGRQSEAGSDAVVIGDVANGIPCETALEQDRPFAPIRRSGSIGPVTATADGGLWVLIGADSGFEGRTDLYVDRVTVRLTPDD